MKSLGSPLGKIIIAVVLLIVALYIVFVVRYKQGEKEKTQRDRGNEAQACRQAAAGNDNRKKF